MCSTIDRKCIYYFVVKIILFVLEISLYLICVADNPCHIHLYRQMSMVQANNENFQINNTTQQMLLFASSYTSKFLIFLILPSFCLFPLQLSFSPVIHAEGRRSRHGFQGNQ